MADEGADAANPSRDSFEIVAGDRGCGLLILADHASNFVPADYANLGLPEAELERHIGYDIGAEPLARDLARRFGAPALVTRFSRLLIDANRGEDDPTLVMRLSDGAAVPGNARVGAAEIERRLRRFHRPYHQAISTMLDTMLATARVPVVLSVHSYTPAWKGMRRPWHAGVLWDRDPRLAHPLIAKLAEDAALCIGDNQPYLGWLKNDTMYRHATARGLAHALIEVRNDLIATPAGVSEWASRLERAMREAMSDPALSAVRHYGSLADA